MTLENLFLLLLVLLLAFYGVIRPWLRRRNEARMRQATQLEAPRAAPQPRVPPQPPARARGSHRVIPRGVPLAVAVPQAATRRQARSPVSSLLDARQGIVLATLLGPCRALDHSDRVPLS
jgi:hypothetical protein